MGEETRPPARDDGEPATTPRLQVRAEAPGDHCAVSALLTAAFGRPDEAELVVALRAQAVPHVSLVAVRGGARSSATSSFRRCSSSSAPASRAPPAASRRWA